MACRLIITFASCLLAIAAWLEGAVHGLAAPPPRWSAVPLAQVDGWMTAAATAGSYAYVAMGARLVVVDLADPGAAQVVGSSHDLAKRARRDALSRLISRVAVADDVAYLTLGTRLVLADVSRPAAPEVIATIDMPAEGNRPTASFAAVVDRRLYIGIGRQLLIYDVRQRARPQLLGSYRWPKLGFWAPDIVHVNGGRAYLKVSEPSATGFRVLDVSDPVRVRELGVFTPTFRANFAGIVGSRAYFARFEYGSPGPVHSWLVAFDLREPEQPVEVSTTDLGETYVRLSAFGDDVFVQDDAGVVGNVPRRLHRWSVLDPSAPREVAAIDVPARGDVIGMLGDRFAYFSPTAYYGFGVWNGTGADTLASVDLRSPDTAGLGAQLRPLSEPRGLALRDDHLFVSAADGLRVYDRARKASPQQVALLPGNYGALAVAGDRLVALEWTSSYQTLVVAFDVGDPARPRRLGATPTTADAALRIQGRRAYATGGEQAVAVFDLAGAGPPVPLGTLDVDLGERGDGTRRFIDLEVVGEQAYALDGDTTDLYVIDVSDPTRPRLEQRLAGLAGPALTSGPWVPRLAQAGGGYLLLANHDTGLQTIDVADPRTPRRTLHPAITAPLVTLDGDRAYAYGDDILQALDIRAPRRARAVGEASLVADALVADGDLLYGLDQKHGLTVWRLGAGPLYLPLVAKVLVRP
jgi:hypothetical protein